MSFTFPYADSLFQLGLEQPTTTEFLRHSDRRVVAAFFLGWPFITCIHYLGLAALRRPFAQYLIQSILQRPITVPIAEQQLRDANREGNTVQSWLRSTYRTPATKPDRPEGTRHLSVVLTSAFAIGILVQFLSFLDFENSKRDVMCFIVVAWAGISISCAKLAGLLRIAFDLQRLGTGFRERVAIWAVLLLSFGAVLAHATISVGAAVDVPEIPGLTLCYRRHFPITSFLMSGMALSLEIFFAIRTYLLLVPQDLNFRHKVGVLVDVRVARVASILCLELLTFVPSAVPASTTAEFVPFSLGTLLVLAAFNYRPDQSIEPETGSLPTIAPRHTSIIAFLTHSHDNDPTIQISEPTKKPELLPHSPLRQIPNPTPVRTPRRKSSIASHVTYDSDAEARSVHGAVVSFAFKSGDIEPVPAIPHGLFHPKLIGSSRILSMSPQVPPKSPLSTENRRAQTSSLPIPSLLGPSKIELKQATRTVPNALSRTESQRSTIYGSDVIRRPTLAPQKPAPAQVRRAPSDAVSNMTATTSPYTGLDLRHVSMASHSAPFEVRDRYAGTMEPPKTGFHRTSILGANTTDGAASGPATKDDQTRALSAIWLEPWVGGHESRYESQ